MIRIDDCILYRNFERGHTLLEMVSLINGLSDGSLPEEEAGL